MAVTTVSRVLDGAVRGDEVPGWELLVTVARRAADEAARAATWTPESRRDRLAAIDAASAALTAARARVLAAVDESRDWARRGDRTVSAWRARTSRAGSTTAGAELRQAATLTQMPAVEQALLDSEISPTHVDVIAKIAARGTPDVAAFLAAPDTQGTLVALGRRLDGREYARAVDRMVAQADPVSLERGLAVQRANRHLWLTDTADGTYVKGLLDLQAGARLRRALESVAGKPSADDERTSEQRRADALDALAADLLSSPRTAAGAVVPPQVSVIVSEPTWLALTAALHDGDRVPLAERLRGLPPVTDEDGRPLPPSAVAQLVCDSALTRVVVDAQGTPVDLGRTTRLITNEVRRAVVARDGGCAWNGCDAVARWCEGHHIEWWERDGGVTSIENSALLCSFHHHVVHQESLHVERLEPPPHAIDPGARRSRTTRTTGTGSFGLARARYRFTRPDGTVRSEPRSSAPQTARPSNGGPPPDDGAFITAGSSASVHEAGTLIPPTTPSTSAPPRSPDGGPRAHT
ncbi:MAG: HNH endonuclease [Cellulomonas sp.]|nr:HNH endonuclease signature motif containing protein [Cellulomonas sp.]MCR6648896.1 HNH endonuclease [Cellulomonas sp.]